MKTPLSYLHRNRHGTFYFRLTVDGKTFKRSLKTKLPELATMPSVNMLAINARISRRHGPGCSLHGELAVGLHEQNRACSV